MSTKALAIALVRILGLVVIFGGAMDATSLPQYSHVAHLLRKTPDGDVAADLLYSWTWVRVISHVVVGLAIFIYARQLIECLAPKDPKTPV